MELSDIPYRHRFDAAGLLISKANRLADLKNRGAGITSPKDKASLWAAVCYYEMALRLIKPFDPNYNTALNWQCLALIALGRFEDAVAGYEQLLRIAEQTDGKRKDSLMAALARKQIAEHRGKASLPFDFDPRGDAASFDDPPYCMYAQEFCERLAAGKIKQALVHLSDELKGRMPAPKLKSAWDRMTGKAAAVNVALVEHANEWPARQRNEIGWCYFSLTGDGLDEGISVVVSANDNGAYDISAIELGRP